MDYNIESDIKFIKSTLQANNTFYCDVEFGDMSIFKKTEIRYTSRPSGYESSAPDPNKVEIVFDEANEVFRVQCFDFRRLPFASGKENVVSKKSNLDSYDVLMNIFKDLLDIRQKRHKGD